MKQKLSKTIKIMMLTLAVIILFLGAIILPQNVIVTKAASVKISAKKLSLTVGQSKVLKITGTKEKVNWSTNNKSVATVSSKGKVRAKKTGTAKITAKVARKKFTCTVTVKKKVLINSEEIVTPGLTNSIENNFSLLKGHILTYGDTNSDGNKFISLDYDIEGVSAGIVYESSNALFRFIFANSGSVLSLEISENNIKNGEFEYIISLDSGLYGACMAFEVLNTLDKDSLLDWGVEYGNINDELLIEVANSAYGAGYSCWNLLLISEVGLSMSDLGFLE